MPSKQAKTNKVYKWRLTFDDETRQAFITCPKCNTTYLYNILKIHNECPECKAKIEGMEQPK